MTRIACGGVRPTSARIGTRRALGAAAAAAGIVLASWLGATPCHAQPAPEQPQRYAIHGTGIVCTRAPCFSYCARNLASGEVRRFSQFGPSALTAEEQRGLGGAEPVVVDGTLRSLGTGQWSPVEMTVQRVVRHAPELALKPGQCE
jgi:hypothetical protein